MRGWTTQFVVGLAVISLSGFANAEQRKQPNVLWIIAEDFSPDLGCYGDRVVRSPNIDRLAREGVRYTHAFATAPVCSSARSGFMTARYQTSIGAHHHRSHRDDGYQLPAGVHVITKYFRDAGYFTANIRKFAPGIRGTGKTDWNFTAKKPFDGDDWSELKAHQPFFAQINFSETHRKFKKAKDRPVDPADVKLPPYYPDHPVTREDWALYLDTVNHLDRKVGAVLDKLAEDGLSEDTIVFFFGDHGRAHVRGKQWLYDPGIHIPLIVRIPAKHRPENYEEAGAVCDDMVTTLDISVTSMSLAGASYPDNVEGHPFLGRGAQTRDYIIAARDRCDESYDRIRCVRTRRYKYIRNFYPEIPYWQTNRYKDRQYPVLDLMKRLYAEDKLTSIQRRWFAPRKPKHELYDLAVDPHETRNLADSPRHRATLVRLQGVLNHWIATTGDRARDPEPVGNWTPLMRERRQKYPVFEPDAWDKRFDKIRAELMLRGYRPAE